MGLIYGCGGVRRMCELRVGSALWYLCEQRREGESISSEWWPGTIVNACAKSKEQTGFSWIQQ